MSRNRQKMSDVDKVLRGRALPKRLRFGQPGTIPEAVVARMEARASRGKA